MRQPFPHWLEWLIFLVALAVILRALALDYVKLVHPELR